MFLHNDLTTWQTFRRLWPVIEPFKIRILLGIIALASNACCDIAMMWLIKPLLDRGFNHLSNECTIHWICLGFFLLVLLRGLTHFLLCYSIFWVSGQLVMKLRKKLFDHLMCMPVTFFDKNPTPILLSRIIYDTEQVASASSGSLSTLVRSGGHIIGTLIVMFYNSWQLSSILLAIAPLVFISIHFVSKRFRRLSKTLQERVGVVTAHAEQMLKGHKEILLCSSQAIESQRFAQVSDKMRQQQMKITVTASITDPIIQLMATTAMVFLLYATLLPSIHQSITPGTFVLLITNTFSLMRPLKAFTSINSLFQQGMAACQSLFNLLDLATERDDGFLQLPSICGDVVLSGVTFCYPNQHKPALDNINLTIPAGKIIALIGRSGSGKSTLIKLLTRFYEIDSGTIELHGHNIQEYTLASLRRHIAVVPQQIYLFNDTIANNIAYGYEKNYNYEQILLAAQQAHVTDFANSFASGLETVVGENGVLLSGGQRQRIAIARALLRKSRLLILDEATSSLDRVVEQGLQSVLLQLKQHCTLLIIAHHLPTIEIADRVVVLESGKVVKQSEYSTLLAESSKNNKWCI